MAAILQEHSSLRTFLAQNFLVLLTIPILYYFYTCYYAGGLNRYPGPFLAKFGKLWHRIDVQLNRHQLNLVDLHRKYGDVVRIGPTALSISNPDYVSRIYGVSAGLSKSDMYDVFAPRINGKPLPSLLSTRDAKIHAGLHKPMVKEFALTVISEYEPLVDETIRKWIRCLEGRFCNRSGKTCDMAFWVRLFATEAIMDITFSESLGFLESGGDVGGFLASLDANIDEVGLLATMPWTANLFKHNRVVGMFKKNHTMFPAWAATRINARMAARAGREPTAVKNNEEEYSRDFLDRFLDASPTSEPPGYDFSLVMNWCLVNIMAGGDTTSVGLASTVYYLLNNPEKQARLVNELRSSQIPSPISWRDCQTLPYLDGCVREGLRLHPPIGMGLERDAGGLRMPDGYVLPPEAKVSMNAWIVDRQSSVFGDRVDDFVPERWLRQEDLTFGSGTRACTGKPVAFMEMYKAIATLFREFDISLVNPRDEWTTVNRWVTRVENIRCTIKRPQSKNDAIFR